MLPMTSTPFFSTLSSFPHHLSEFSPYTSPSHPNSPLVTCHMSPHSLHVIFHLSLSLTLHLLIPSPLDTCPHVILYVTIVHLLKTVLTSHLPRWISGKTRLIFQKRKRFVSEIGWNTITSLIFFIGAMDWENLDNIWALFFRVLDFPIWHIVFKHGSH